MTTGWIGTETPGATAVDGSATGVWIVGGTGGVGGVGGVGGIGISASLATG